MMKNEPTVSRKKLIEILEDRQEVLNLLQQRPYTCAVVRSWYNDKEYIGYGFSKVCYPDRWDDELGADIAVKRAIIMIMREIRAYEKGLSMSEAYQFMKTLRA